MGPFATAITRAVESQATAPDSFRAFPADAYWYCYYNADNYRDFLRLHFATRRREEAVNSGRTHCWLSPQRRAA